ncbi:hypothetical protein HY311_03860 [Candidatus Nomurabacteria bacterium]|nr:hypothetical protein [Candidatus Nomurabacteria bacterium]
MENQEKQNVSEPHVRIFNEEVNSRDKGKEKVDEQKNDFHHYHHHYHEGRHFGSGVSGLAVFFVGILLLLNTFGLASRGVWNYIWPFWPVLLILMGIRIITGYNKVARFFIFIFSLVMFSFIVLYALIHVGSPLVYNLNLSPDFINYILQLR